MRDASPSSLSAATAVRVARLLLVAVIVLLGGLVIAVVGWVRAARVGALERLSADERQQLAGELLEDAPGVYAWAYFAPRIGYTLHPDRALAAWGDRFRSNEIGYRTAAVAKPPGTFRVLFVGDSWTYGMGVRQLESYPEVVAALANAHAGVDRPIQAFTLALPGYNTDNELAALWYFFDRLEPDAVVLGLAANDNHSGFAVLPNGSTTGRGIERDEQGDPHHLDYRVRMVDSFRYRARWAHCYTAIRATEERLATLGVPFALAFVGRMRAPEAHAGVASAGIEAPYVVVPIELTKGRWKAGRWGHGSAEANALYGRMVYHLLQPLLGWAELPGREPLADEVPIHDGPPAGEDWAAIVDRLYAEETALLADSWRSGTPEGEGQALGPFDARSGVLDRATTLLVRLRPGARRAVVTLRALPDAPSLYPLRVKASIPSPGGGTRAELMVVATPGEQRLELPVPTDLVPGCALDLMLEAERTVADRRGTRGRSVEIVSVELVNG